MSYPKTGSTGDGYELTKKLGHNIVDVKPGLIPLKTYSDTCSKLQGLTLKNILLKVFDDSTNIYEDFGELLFTHFGLSGPVILSASSKINRIENLEEKLKARKVKIVIDLKPALDYETLDKRICRDFDKYANKEYRNSLYELFPQKLVPVIVELSKIDEIKKVHQITKEERKNLVNVIKNFEVYIKELMPIDLSVITCGGVNVNEVNPKTMESKIVEGLYIVGEVLDIDAYTGGYNLQIAFSTAYAAGKNV
jgi:predicted Rossmann fold flavoprotein